MQKRRYEIVVRHQFTCHGSEPVVSLGELARVCRCHPELVERLVRFGLIEPVNEDRDAPLFPRSSIQRLRRALRLRRDLGLNANALSLVLDLLDRIEGLETELMRLKGTTE